MSSTLIEHITLDGVMQAPGLPDEDTRRGLRHGGWSTRYSDPAVTAAWGQSIARATSGSGGFLLGRLTYLGLIEAWPGRNPGHPYTETLTKTPKYVASTTLTEPLPWQNSTLLTDAARQVAELKQDRDLVIMGSGALVQSLMHAGLIDEFLLTIHPLVLGQGRRLFPEAGQHAELTLVEAKPAANGVIIAIYRPVR